MPELRRISARLTVRKGNRTQWELTNPVLLDGELGYSSDTRVLKIGDGKTEWNALPFYETQGGGVNSAYIHAGDIFPAGEAGTPRDAIEYTQKQINTWNSCALQDFEDAINRVTPSCISDGTL